MNRQTLIIIVLFTVGLLAGWFGHKGTQDILQAEERETTEAATSSAEDKVRRALEKEQHSSLPSVLPETHYEANAPSIIEYVQQRSESGTYQAMGDHKLRNLIHQTPNLAYELLEQLILLEDGTSKENLTQLLLGLQLVKRANLDKWIIDKIRLEQQPSAWLQVLGKLGAQSVDSVLFLNDRFSSLTESADIKAAISAVGNPSFGAPNIAPTERTKLIANIKPHLDSNDESVRAAAVASLHNYPSEDLELQVLKALGDQSNRVRANAQMVFINRLSQSKVLKTQAIANLQNSSLHPIERRSIASITSQLQLDASERAIVEQANSEIKAALSEMSKEDFIEYARQAQANR